VAAARDYVGAAATFLADFEGFVVYEQQALAIERRYLAHEPRSYDLGATDFHSARNAIRSDLKRAKRTRRAYLRLDPPADVKKLDELNVEAITIKVDFFEDVLTGVENLSKLQIYDALRDYFGAATRNNRRISRATAGFAAHSHLQDASIRLTEMADELEDTIAGVGSGSVDDTEPDRTPKRPAAPAPAGGGGEEGESHAAAGPAATSSASSSS
jgi:hypothetical protein